MFNWSGNKGSFKGQIPFYGKTGIEFYTERKVCFPLDMEVQADGRLLLPCGLREMLLDIKLLSTCLSLARWTGSMIVLSCSRGFLEVTLVDTHEDLMKDQSETITSIHTTWTTFPTGTTWWYDDFALTTAYPAQSPHSLSLPILFSSSHFLPPTT
jgi:hypothetical protein